MLHPFIVLFLRLLEVFDLRFRMLANQLVNEAYNEASITVFVFRS